MRLAEAARRLLHDLLRRNMPAPFLCGIPGLLYTFTRNKPDEGEFFYKTGHKRQKLPSFTTLVLMRKPCD
jgi:hypothetical protein